MKKPPKWIIKRLEQRAIKKGNYKLAMNTYKKFGNLFTLKNGRIVIKGRNE